MKMILKIVLLAAIFFLHSGIVVVLSVDSLRNSRDEQPNKCGVERRLLLNVARNGNVTGSFVPSCDSQGAYLPVQCHLSTGYCWCVSPNGRPIPNTSVQFRRPICNQFGKIGRRSSRKNLNGGTARCNYGERARFNNELLKHFRTEFDRQITAQEDVSSLVPKPRRETPSIVTNPDRRIIQWKFTELDKNNDGRLSARELRTLHKLARRNIQPKACARAFKTACDYDRDSFVAAREWLLCLEADANMMYRMFASLNSTDLTSTTARQGGYLSLGGSLSQGTTLQPWTSDRSFDASNLLRNAAASSDFDDMRLREYSTKRPLEEDTEKVTCKAEREKALRQLQATPDQRAYVPECFGPDNVLFSPAQCHAYTGYCWCANIETGQAIAGTTVRDGRSPQCDGSESGGRQTQLNARGHRRKTFSERCAPRKQARFYIALYKDFEEGLNATAMQIANEQRPKMNKTEASVIAKFNQLDLNKNNQLERREWRDYRNHLRNWDRLKRCGRTFIRFCDKDGNKVITFPEWFDCTWRGAIARRSRTGTLNPFIHILTPD